MRCDICQFIGLTAFGLERQKKGTLSVGFFKKRVTLVHCQSIDDCHCNMNAKTSAKLMQHVQKMERADTVTIIFSSSFSCPLERLIQVRKSKNPISGMIIMALENTVAHRVHSTNRK